MGFYNMLKYVQRVKWRKLLPIQCGVVALQWCHYSRGHGVHGKCAYAHDQGTECACMGGRAWEGLS